MRRSSSVERETKERRSWRGSWYLRNRGAGRERVAARWDVREERVEAVVGSIESMRVSPPM